MTNFPTLFPSYEDYFRTYNYTYMQHIIISQSINIYIYTQKKKNSKKAKQKKRQNNKKDKKGGIPGGGGHEQTQVMPLTLA